MTPRQQKSTKRQPGDAQWGVDGQLRGPRVAAAWRVQAAMIARGTSLRAWSIAHHYRPGTVAAVVKRWSWRPECTPHGGLARQIMSDLRAELGPDVFTTTPPEHDHHDAIVG